MRQKPEYRPGISNELHRPDYHTTSCMFDGLTGLPSYYLFEDRLQAAINYENYRDIRLKRSKIAVLGINVDNIDYFENPENTLHETAARLKLYMPVNYTVARGIRYSFWLMMTNLNGREDTEVEISKARTVLKMPMPNGERVLYSMGASLYTGQETEAKVLVEHAISALQRAQAQGENHLVFFGYN